MKTNKNLNFSILLTIIGCALFGDVGRAATAIKQGTGTDLTGATAGVWSGGSGADGSPTSADIASWTNSSLGAGLTLGTSEAWGGISVSNALTDIYIGGAGTLTNGASGIDLSASTVNLTITNAIALGANQIWAVNSGVGLTNFGGVSGAYTLTMNGAGTLSLNGGKTYTGLTTVNAGTLNLGSSVTLAGNPNLTISSGAVVQSSATLSLNAAGGGTTAVSGSGTLVLTGTTNSASFPDIYMAANDVASSGANDGVAIATPINLGSLQRYIWGNNNHNSPDHDGSTTASAADGKLNGSISGAGGLTFIAQDSYNASSPMETPLCLNASNSFTGPVIIERGAVYVGNAYGFPAGDQLTFDSSGTNNALFLLYGQNVTVANLSSINTGAGTNWIVNGVRNPSGIGPATLTVVENTSGTFSGFIEDTNAQDPRGTAVGSSTILSLVVNGTGTLTLANTNTYSGTTTVNGSLRVNGSLQAAPGGVASAVTVQSGGTLGGNGTINGTLAIQGGGTLTAGTNSNVGTLTLGSTLTLNAGSTNFMRITKTGGTPASDLINGWTGTLTYAGTLVVSNITSDATLLANGDTFTLFTGSGIYGGSFNNLILPALPAGLSWNVSQLTVNGSISVVNTAATPVFNPPAGSYVITQPMTVTISSATAGATIYYTTNGTTPTSGSPSGITPVTVIVPAGTNMTIQAYTHAAGFTDSGVASAGYLTEAEPAVWTDVSGGSWSTSSNWTNNIVPNGSDVTADFSRLTLAGSTYVTLDGNWIIGNLIFGDQGNVNTWEIDPGSGGPLLLAATNNTPTITVNNQTTTITAVVAGTQGLATAGAGTLILSGANTYTGNTTIAAGTLLINDPGSLGGGTYGGQLTDNGGFIQNSTVAQTFNGNIVGAGSLTAANSGSLTLNGMNTYAGGTVLSNAATALAIGNGSALGSGPLDLSQANGSLTVTVANNNAVTLSNNIVLTTAGVTDTLVKDTASSTSGTPLALDGNISGGSTGTILYLNSNTSSDQTTTYLFAGNNTFQVYRITVNRGSLVVGSPLGLGNPANTVYLDSENGSLGDMRFAISMTLTNPIQLVNSGNTISTGTNNVTLVGQISGSEPLTKLGTGTLAFGSANTSGNSYGSTTVSAGVLEVDCQLSSAVTVTTNAGLDGVGMIYNPVTVNAGGTLAAGTNSVVGTLSMYNTLTLNAGSTNFMRITKTGGTPASDLVSGWTGTLNYAGTLVVSNITSDATVLAAGDTFTLFTGSGSYGGGFNNLILPALSAGLSWNVSQLTVNGSISVVNTAATPVFNPSAGGYAITQPMTVTISSLTPGATIYYTTNGTTPTSGSASGISPVTVVVPVGTNMTVQAYTHAAGYSDSGVASATYQTEAAAVWTVPSGGSWSTASNWTNNIVPNNGSVTADFSQLTLSGNSYVTLDGIWTIGNLIFGDQGNTSTWEIDPGSGGPLTLAATNTPTITVKNQTTTITAGLAGTNGLTFAGAGALILGGSNTYSGATTIAVGALQINDPGMLGGGTYNDLITNNGSFTYDSTVAQTLNGNISGTGSLALANSGALTLDGTNTYAGGTVLSNAATALTIGNGSALGSGTLDLSQAASSPTLTVPNTGAVTLSNNIVLSTAGGTDTLIKTPASNTTGLPLTLAGNISGGSSGTILYLNTTANSDYTTTFLFTGNNTFLAQEIYVNRGSLVVGSPSGAGDPANLIYLSSENGSLGDLRFAISMTLTNPIDPAYGGGNTINAGGNIVTLLGQVSDSQPLTEVGTGTLVFSGANLSGNAAGNTTISGGTLEVDCPFSPTALTVDSSATLAGSNTVNSAVTVNAGGTLAAGNASAAGTLTVAGTLTLGNSSTGVTTSQFKIAAGGAIAATTALNVSGTDVVNILDPSLTVGTNTLFAYGGGSIGGSSGFGGFQLGTLPAGAVARLLDTGSAVQLAVTSVFTVNTNSPVLTNSVSGNTLTLSWPANHLGWRLEVQTNALNTGLGNTWFTWPGSTNVTTEPITISPANPAVFFRLVYP